MKHPLIFKFRTSFSEFRESVVQNLFLVCNAILISRSTNLFVMKDYLSGLLENDKTKGLSHYTRLIRFFKMSQPNLMVDAISKWIYQLLCCQVKHLVLDATLWERGEKQIHLLTLCIVYRGIAIPIFWSQMCKKGGMSSQEDRKLFFEQALKRYDLKGKILVADREFIGDKWFHFLTEKGIDFVIRLPKNAYKNIITESPGFSHWTFGKKALRRKSPVGKVFKINEITYTFVAVKNTQRQTNEPILFLISSLTDFKQITRIYKTRWKIETCFRQLKTKGFNIEDLNFMEDNKIVLMMAIVVMAYVLSIEQGLKANKKTIKKYKNGQTTLAISIFRMGLTEMRAKAGNLNKFIRLLFDLFYRKKNPKWVNV